jgi:hypothetical protein
MISDEAVLLEAKKLNIEINNPMPGKQMAEFIETLHRLDPKIVSATRDAMNPR